MTNCDYCGKMEDNPVGYNRNFCDSCVSDKEIGVPHTINTVFIRGYGNTSAERIKELGRRVILPEEPKDGRDYIVGRRGENGKIQDREPTY